jgi:hypothetical protein
MASSRNVDGTPKRGCHDTDLSEYYACSMSIERVLIIVLLVVLVIWVITRLL